jgi:hypothetical protein
VVHARALAIDFHCYYLRLTDLRKAGFGNNARLGALTMLVVRS